MDVCGVRPAIMLQYDSSSILHKVAAGPQGWAEKQQGKTVRVRPCPPHPKAGVAQWERRARA